MRELEGLSYREIGDRLELSRPAVESALFRARRRLEREYREIEAGRRCQAVEQAIARIAESMQSDTGLRRLSRHARRCAMCRRRARQMGVEPLRVRRAAARAAAPLPLPEFLRRGLPGWPASAFLGSDAGVVASLITPNTHLGTAVAERAAAVVTAVAIAGAGGAVSETWTAFTLTGPLVAAMRERPRAQVTCAYLRFSGGSAGGQAARRSAAESDLLSARARNRPAASRGAANRVPPSGEAEKPTGQRRAGSGHPRRPASDRRSGRGSIRRRRLLRPRSPTHRRWGPGPTPGAAARYAPCP
jgi:Sigma-70, region 4